MRIFKMRSEAAGEISRSQPAFWHKLKIALIIFLPISFLISGILWGFYYHDILTIRENIEEHSVNMITLQSSKIGNNLSLIVSDLLFFSGYTDVSRQVNLDNSQ